MKEDKKLQSTESEIKEGQVIETKKPKKEHISDEKVNVRRGRFDSLCIYDITEGELDTIEKGSPNSLYLNFSIFLISIAISFLISLMTNDYSEKQAAFTIFTVITVVGFILGILLLIMWFRTKNEFDETISKIKDRMKE
ncbi:MAG: hypothetical protein PHE08_08090 [Bacteroidales bacterium]|nr:hypothetical protein [Bacteroidales bacterium]